MTGQNSEKDGKEVKGFIEVTEQSDGLKVLIPVSGIRSVIENPNGFAMIEYESMDFGSKAKDRFTVIWTAEDYEEIKEKIQNEV